MTNTTADPVSATAAPRLGLLARIFGVLLSPRDTYADVAAHPRFLGVLLLTIIVATLPFSWLFSTEIGQEALLDQQIRAIEAFGMTVSDQMYEQMEAGVASAAYTTPLWYLIGIPLMTALTTGILLAVFNAVLDGNASFKQVFAIQAHAGVIFAVHALFNAPMMYARGDMSSATALSVFFPMLDETSFFTYFFGVIDLFYVWWMVSLAIGLGVLYRRRTGPIATTLLVLYAGLALAYAAVRAF